MSLEPPVLADRWFMTPPLPPKDSPDLEKQCHSDALENKETFWARIWSRLLSLVFKTDISATPSKFQENVPTTPNTGVASDQLVLEFEIVTEPVDPPNDSAELTQAQPDSQSRSSLESETRVLSPPSPPPRNPSTLAGNNARLSWSSSATMEPWPHNLSDEKIDSTGCYDIVSFIEGAGCSVPPAPSPIPFLDRSTAKDVDLSGRLGRPHRDSATIPFSLYRPHPYRD